MQRDRLWELPLVSKWDRLSFLPAGPVATWRHWGRVRGVTEESPLAVREGEAEENLCFQIRTGNGSQRAPRIVIPLFPSFALPDCNSADHVKSQDSQHTPHSMTPSNASAPRSSTPSHGLTATLEPASGQKTPSKVVYVFSTEMANK